jgi:hypothetical protein
MPVPLYFLPKVTQCQLNPEGKLNRSLLASRGLGDQFADVLTVPQDAALFELAGVGPGGNSGCILSALPPSKEPPLRTGFYPDFQRWTEFEGPGGPVWIGLDTEHPTTAADLARPKQFDGHTIELGGQQWTIPIIRDPLGGTSLPRDWIVGNDGLVAERIKETYVDLWSGFTSVVDLFYNPADPAPAGAFRCDRSEAMRRCLQAIGLNYRVGRFEQNLLSIVDAENWSSVLAAAVDLYTFWEVYRQAQEKKRDRDAAILLASRQGPTDAPSGPPEDSPVTGPAEAT